ncbi:unnamed protein product [Lepeophtheirus salmonis]|uniref:(salmon louse) hypothetical protein n=1 Tax=Lepeophtheirus salmonis TaxID=72036 RepID=A0A7R8CJ93_LEPSM|nr:unnamed protein product [Lepeophtheirus salmonis]CAF2838470.1 unnamed protein product [Lepeophtheirus salmonis]
MEISTKQVLVKGVEGAAKLLEVFSRSGSSIFFTISSPTNSPSIDPPCSQNNKSYLKSPHQRLNSLENSFVNDTASSLLAHSHQSTTEEDSRLRAHDTSDNYNERSTNSKIGCKVLKDSQRVVALRHQSIYGSDISPWRSSMSLADSNNTEPLHPWFENAFNAYVDSGDDDDFHFNEKDSQNDEESWIKILALLNNSLSTKNHLSFTSLHKLLVSGVAHASSPIVRASSAHLFRKVINFLSIPDSKKVRSYYLKALAREEKSVEEFDDMESWELLDFLLETIFSGSERYILLFNVVVELMEIDFDLWYRSNVKRKNHGDGFKSPPLIYKVLRFLRYVAAISDKVPKTVISSLRIIISILAQMIGFRNNESKLEFVHFFASIIKEQDSLLTSDKRVLIMELYLIKPTWLSFCLSHSLITQLTHLSHQRAKDSLHPFSIIYSTKKTNNSIRKMNISVDKRNAYGETPLHIACKRGNLERVYAILSCPKVDVNAKDHNGWTPLHEACSNNMVGCVKALLDFKPADILSYLFAKGSKSSSQKKRVDILSVAGEQSVNPFHESVMAGNIEMVTLIMDKVQSDSEFPSIKDLIHSTTGKGQNCMDLAISEEMKRLLQDFNRDGVGSVSIPRTMYVDKTQFKIIRYLITNFLSKYISYFGLHVQKEYLHLIARKNVKKKLILIVSQNGNALLRLMRLMRGASIICVATIREVKKLRSEISEASVL